MSDCAWSDGINSRRKRYIHLTGYKSFFFLPDFPSSQFNHIIVSVPLARDIVWLECMSQDMSAGYLSGVTADRYAQIQTETKFRAMAQDDLHSMIHALAPDKVKEYLNRSISLPQYELIDFSYQETVNELPVMTEKLDMKATHFATVRGKWMFFTPNVCSKTRTNLGEDTARTYDLLLQREFRDIDTVTIQVPAGYRPEAIPQPISIESRFGTYQARTVVEGDRIHYYRQMERYSGRYPAATYAELVKFYEKVYKADRMRVVLVL
jgi:hypothetical protein